MKKIFLGLLILASGMPSAHAMGRHSAKAPSPAGSNSELEGLVAQFAPMVEALDRPITVYHYVSREGAHLPVSGAVNSVGAEAQRYLSMMLDYFWNPAQPIDKTPAAGLYAAVDPIISREYGKKNWALFEFEIPAGTRLLNIQAPVQVAVAEDGSDVVISPVDESCTSAPELFFVRASRRCRELGLQVLRQLGVSAILYDYATTEFRECGHYRPGSAFILIGHEAYSSAQLFVREIPGGVDPLREGRQRINSLLARAEATHLPSAVHFGPERYAPMWDVGGVADPSALGAWMREHLFGCGPHPEDGPGAPFPGF